MAPFLNRVPFTHKPAVVSFTNTTSFCPTDFDDRASFTSFFQKQWDDAFSISWWGRFEVIGSGLTEYFVVFANNNTNTSGQHDGLDVFMAGSSIIYSPGNVGITFSHDSNTGTGGASVWEPTLSINTWYHFCMTYDGSKTYSTGLKLYIDNSTISASITTNPPGSGTIPYNSSDAYIIDTPNLSFEAGEGACQVDEISLWNVELSASEVSSIYNSGSPNDLLSHSQSANLEAWYRFEEDVDSGNTAVDTAGNHDGTYHTTVDSSSTCAEVP